MPAFHVPRQPRRDALKQDNRLGECGSDHPFAVLGPQPLGDGWVVKAWMPEAQSVALLLDGEAT